MTEAKRFLIIILIVIILALCFVIVQIARRNIRLTDDNREITKDSIKGFKDVIVALNAIREQLQIGDNAIMGKVDDTKNRIYSKVVETQQEIVRHLQYLRDRTK